MTIGSLDDLKYTIDWLGGNPSDGDADFVATAQIFIGTVGDNYAEAFDLTVCSPNRLAEWFDPTTWTEDGTCLLGGNVLPVRGLWLMKVWSRTGFREVVERLLHSCLPAPDFDTFAYRVGMYMPWEFDYRYERDQNLQAGLPPIRTSFWDDDWQPAD